MRFQDCMLIQVVIQPADSTEREKASFFKLAKDNKDVQKAFTQLGNAIPASQKLIKECEKAVCKLYKHQGADVNQVQYDMLAKGAESHHIPPTSDALALHTKRANYQAHIWKNALKADFKPCPADGHGWKKVDGVLDIHWMTRAPTPDSVLELVACKSCKKCDTRRCPCQNKGFKCTDACGCDSNSCENSEDTGRYIAGEDDSSDEELKCLNL